MRLFYPVDHDILRRSFSASPTMFNPEIYDGKVCPRVSAPKGVSTSPMAKAMPVSATGVPIDPKCRTPAPTRNVIPAPANRANEVEKAKALARHSVGYCSGNHSVNTEKFAPPSPRKNRQTKNQGNPFPPRQKTLPKVTTMNTIIRVK